MRSRKVKKGSALVIVLVIFMVVSITGMALLGTALQNYTNRSLMAKSKFNLYMSSSGIDEAYAIINDYVEEAVKYSNLETDNLVDEIIKKDKEALDKLFELNSLDIKTDEQKAEINRLKDGLKFYNDEGKVKLEELKEYQNDLFQKHFYGYFDNTNTSFSIKNSDGTNSYIKDKKNIAKLINEIETTTYKLSEDKKENQINVQIKNTKALKDNEIESPFNISLVAKFQENDIEKEIMAQIEVTSPEYDSNTAISSNYVNLIKNPVWSKPLIVGKNLEIKGGSVDVTGGIYVQGLDKEGGALISDKNSKLEIDGDFITSQSLIFNYDNEENQTIANASTVEIEGNAYARNLIVEKDEDSHSNGAEGAKVTIKKSADGNKDGSIYVLDDMEINADKSTIDIEGSYYGVSDGSDSKENKVDNSSAININCNDLGEDNGTSIRIGENMYLAGTAYISGLQDPYGIGEYKYQTGESIAIKGNYKAYSKNLDKDRTIAVGDGTEKNLKNDVVFSYFNPLKLLSDYKSYSWSNVNKIEENIYNITVGLTKIGQKNFPTADKITTFIKDGEKKIILKDKIEIGEEFTVTSDNISDLDNRRIYIDIYDKSESKLGDTIVTSIIDEEMEGFMQSTEDNKTNVIMDMTAYGKSKNQEAAYYRINGEINQIYPLGKILTLDELGDIKGQKYLDVDILDKNEKLLKSGIRVKLEEYLDNLNLYTKSQYFKYYTEDYEEDINKGNGIQIGYKLQDEKKDFLHAGIIFDNNNLLESSYFSQGGAIIDNEYKFKIKKLQLKDKLFYMDFLERNHKSSSEQSMIDVNDINNSTQYKDFLTKISDGYNEKILEPYITVHNLINFHKDEDNDGKIDTIIEVDNKDNILIFDGNEKNYTISNGIITTNSINKNINNGRGIIIINGDLHISGEVNFEGIIITSGNVYIEKGAELSISYKEKAVEMLVARNYDKLKDIFKIKNSFDLDSEKVDIYDIENGNRAKVKPVVIKRWGIVK